MHVVDIHGVMIEWRTCETGELVRQTSGGGFSHRRVRICNSYSRCLVYCGRNILRLIKREHIFW